MSNYSSSKLLEAKKNEVSFTRHSEKRMSRRNINKEEIELCLKYGRIFYKTGIRFHVLLRKNIIKYNLDNRLEGICVLISNENSIITVYKNKEISRKIKSLEKKEKTR